MPARRVLVFAFLLLCPPLLAQETALEGTVVDPHGSAVAGASVVLQSRDRSGLHTRSTASDGSFQFLPLPAGDYLLEAGAPGFSAAVRSIRLDARRRERLWIELPVAGVSERVTVTAAGAAQSVTEVSRAVSIVDAEELDLRQKLSLAAALRDVPGLRVQQTAGPGSFTKLVFRGLRTTNTSLLLDGLPFRDAAGFRGDLASFFAELNPNNVSSIEVVRGAGSALYGSAATGGVINFVPQEGAAATRFDFGYEGGSLAQAVGRSTLSGALGDKLAYSAGVIRRDVNAGVDGNDVWRNTNLSGHARYRLRPDMSLTGNVYFSHTPRLNLNDSPFPIGPPGNELGFETGRGPVAGFIPNLDAPDDFRSSSMLPASIRFDHRPDHLYSYSVACRAARSHRNFVAGAAQHPLAVRLGVFKSTSDLNRFDGEDHLIQTRHNLEMPGRNLFTVGYEHNRQSSTQEFISAAFRNPVVTDRQSSHGVFFHNQLALLDRRLQIGLGGRFATFRVANPESIPELRDLRTPDAKTGDVSISYFLPRTRTKLRAHGGNSFREPSLSERFQVLTLSGQRVRVGNPLIEPERSVTIDGGIDQYLWSDRIQVGATYYYNRLQSLIQSRTLFRQTNVRGGLSRGVEVEARARPLRNLSLKAGYTYTNSLFIPTLSVPRAGGTVAPAGVSRRLEAIPRHTYSFSATGRRGRWDGFFDLFAITNYDASLFSPVWFQQVLFRMDGFASANIGAGYTRALSERWSMRWYGRVENVFNNPYFEDGFRAPRAVGLVGVRFLY